MPPSAAGRSCGRTARKNARHGPRPERAGRVLEALVEAAQHRRHRQEDEREVGQRRDQHRAAEALEVGADGHPGVGVDERRHRERAHHQHPPEPARRAGRSARPARRRRSRATRERDRQHDQRARCCASSSPTRGRHSRSQAGVQPMSNAFRRRRRAAAADERDEAATSRAATTAVGGADRGSRGRFVRHEGGHLEDAGLRHQLDDLGTVEGVRVHVRGLEGGQRLAAPCRTRRPLPTAYSLASLVASMLLALLAGDEGEELLGVGRVLARLEDRRRRRG